MTILKYSLLRVLVFAVTAALLWLVGLRGLLLVLVALLVSGVLSLFVLRRPRGEVSERLARRLTKEPPRDHDTG
ncbi:MAG TPA: DUF4229 domain-containing protein [Jiangellaceae bacterium]|nr:DUF4229 domain-containing protein [Jiangellaceae bacterium]